MDFTKDGLIRIEGKENDGEILGHAVALGTSLIEEELQAGREPGGLSPEKIRNLGNPALKRFKEADIDTQPRVLTPEEVRAAFQGLTAMSFLHSQGFRVALRVGNVAGENGRRAFVDYGEKARSYLFRIIANTEIELDDLFAA